MYANKKLGQHFLCDQSIIAKIIAAIAPKKGDNLVEIGAGKGALTWQLLRALGRMSAIEFDARFYELLREKSSNYGELNLITGDVLRCDFRQLTSGAALRVVGNLPYNLSSPILFHCLQYRDVICDINIMLQKEVAARICAAVGSAAYGRLSIMLEADLQAKYLFDVPPQAFRPPPQVDSAFICLSKRPAPLYDIVDRPLFAQLVRSAFAQRRKMVRKSLAAHCSVAQLEAAQINPTARAQNLSGADFAALCRVLTVQ